MPLQQLRVRNFTMDSDTIDCTLASVRGHTDNEPRCLLLLETCTVRVLDWSVRSRVSFPERRLYGGALCPQHLAATGETRKQLA